MSFQMITSVILMAILPCYGMVITSAETFWPITTALFAFCLLRIGQSLRTLVKYHGIPFLLALNVVNTLFFLSYYLQDEGFNAAFLYHFNLNVIYADIGSYWWLLVYVLVQTGLLLVFSIKTVRIHRPFKSKVKLTAYVIFLVVNLYLSPPINEIIDILSANDLLMLNKEAGAHSNKSFQDFAKRAQVTLAGPQKFKNFVFIYLESLEQTYFDNDIFPDLLPGMSKIRNSSVDFQNIVPTPGMYSTMFGVVASQCGLPLITPFGHLQSAGVGLFGEFMPKAECLGDTLSASSYALTFMGGADLRFGSKGTFFRDHGFDEVLGRQELTPKLTEKTPVSSWGIYDDSLLNLAFDHYLQLAKGNGPFGLFLLTLDTHPPNGFPSPTCSQYTPIDNLFLDAVHCTDQLVTRFVNLVRSSPYSEDTVIFFLSDHLAERNSASHYLTSTGKERKLTFFTNYPDESSNVNTNRGTALDIPATIIDLLGINKQGELFGFGRSLVDQNGYFTGVFNDIKTVSSAWCKEYVRSLWDNVGKTSFLEGAHINLQDLSVLIGESRYNIRRWGNFNEVAPTLFEFDGEEYSLKELYTYSYLEDMPSGGLAPLLLAHPSSIYLAISPAKYVQGLLKEHPENEDDVYVLMGESGGSQPLCLKLAGDIIITPDMVRKLGTGQR